MPRYIVERNVGTLTQEDLEAVAKRSKEVLATMPNVIWVKSYISEAERQDLLRVRRPQP